MIARLLKQVDVARCLLPAVRVIVEVLVEISHFTRGVERWGEVGSGGRPGAQVAECGGVDGSRRGAEGGNSWTES